MDKLNDQHYINLIIDGDANAFSKLVELYKNFVFTLSLKMLQNREEAEEVSQDTFIKIYRSLHKFKGESKFSTWLYKVTYNACLDRLKIKKRQQPVVAITEFTEHEVISLINILNSIEDREREQTIQNCINLLPAEDSFLLTLYYFRENSLKEISQIIGINENHLKIKLFRSRKKLASILKDQLEPEILNQYEKQGR